MNTMNPLRSLFRNTVRGKTEVIVGTREAQKILDSAAEADKVAQQKILDDAAADQAAQQKILDDATAAAKQQILDEAAGAAAKQKVLDDAAAQKVLDDAAADAADAAAKQKVLDDAAAAGKVNEVLDDTGSPGSDYADTDIALKAVACVHEWADTGDLDDGEGYADRLLGLFAGVADVDGDGEISEDEADVIELAANAAWDYLSEKGVSDEDLDALLNDWDNDVAATVHELVKAKMPDGDEALANEMEEFVFGDGSDESALDAVYRKKLVVRKGKKVRINKRVSGKVRLTTKQKMAVRKMLRKSHSAKATMRRAKSVRIRKQSGL